MNVISRNLCDTCQCLFFDKYTVSASLSKCITINSAKLILAQFYSTKSNSKHKNHYDALKITPYATQSEIKSAYYKLSLQYHPDKNKSNFAKQKFQDISDAYEILSNHEQRKNYDRQMRIRQQPVTNIKESQHRTKVYTGATKIYNFDAWTQAHYGKQFQLDRLRRSNYEMHKRMDERPSDTKISHIFESILFFFILMVMIMIHYKNDHDVTFHKKKKDREE